eukprot:15456352-Alexandrium_andersonii.AAC.1
MPSSQKNKPRPRNMTLGKTSPLPRPTCAACRATRQHVTHGLGQVPPARAGQRAAPRRKDRLPRRATSQ